MHVHRTVYVIYIGYTVHMHMVKCKQIWTFVSSIVSLFAHFTSCKDAEASISHWPRHILPLIGVASHILPLLTGLSNIASCNWPPRHILRGLFFLHGLPHSRQHHFDFPRSSQAIHQCQQQAEKFSREEETWNQTISDLTLSDLTHLENPWKDNSCWSLTLLPLPLLLYLSLLLHLLADDVYIK